MTTREDSRLYDVRTLERKLRKGIINKKDYERYLKGLPDRADNTMPVHTEEEAPRNGENR